MYIQVYTQEIDFEWDAEKNAFNIKKHGISFEEAKCIFDGLVFTAQDTREEYGEARFISVGSMGGAVVFVVVHTLRDGRIRLISARKASHKERKTYHDCLKEKT